MNLNMTNINVKNIMTFYIMHVLNVLHGTKIPHNTMLVWYLFAIQTVSKSFVNCFIFI